MGSNKVPISWRGCPNISGLICDKFIPFKTPLSTKFDSKLKEENFHVCDVFEHVKKERLELGLWFNLTNTKRYYDESELDGYNVQYVALPCLSLDRFVMLCTDFIKNNPSKVIGVHCTHGFNRTGYLIVYFMVKVFSWNVLDALKEFARIRPPGIYRQYLVNDLCRIFNAHIVHKIETLPAWCDRKDRRHSRKEYWSHRKRE